MKSVANHDDRKGCMVISGLGKFITRLAASNSAANLQVRLRAGLVHFLVSVMLVGGCAALVFSVWYPGDFRNIAGGKDLFLLLVSVDVVLGPFLTTAVFDLRKGLPVLRRDLAIIVLIQLAALGYGMHTAMVARPIALAFEVDRFRVLSSLDIKLDELSLAPPEFRKLPLAGPWLLGARQPVSVKQREEALFTAFGGFDISQRPVFWRPYKEFSHEAFAKARPISFLITHYSARKAELEKRLKDLQLDVGTVRFLPVVARNDWVAVLDSSGNVKGFLPFDGFI